MDQGRALQEGQRLVAGRRLLARASLAGSHNIEPGRSPTSPGLSAAKSQTSNVAYHPERGGGSNLPREVRVLPAHRLGVMSYAQRYGPGWCRILERSQTLPGRSPTSPGLSAAKSQTSNVAYYPERGGGSNLPREVRVLPAHRLGVMSYAQRYGPGWCRISERSQTPPGRSLTFPGWSVVKSQTSRSEEFSPLPNRSKPPDRSAELLLFALSPGRLGL